MAEQQELKLDGANSGKKTKLIIIIAGVVVFLALVGGGLAFFLGGSSEEEAVATQALPKPGQAMPGAKVVHYIKFDQPFVVSLNTRPRERMLQVYVAVVVSDEQTPKPKKTKQFLVYLHRRLTPFPKMKSVSKRTAYLLMKLFNAFRLRNNVC